MEIAIKNLDSLREKFLEIENKFPFVSGDVFKFLGYTRHSNFKRDLNHKKNFKHLLFTDTPSIINIRETEVIRLDRELFYNLATKKYPYLNELGEFYALYKKELYKNKVLRFSTRKERSTAFNLPIYGDHKGLMYVFSLSTLNYANAIDYCPFDLYKFYCYSEFRFYGRREIKDSWKKNVVNYPYAKFDNIDYRDRQYYLEFMNLAFDELKLTPLQKELHKIYYDLIVELLRQQKLFDIKAGRLKVNERTDVELSKVMKGKYREAALVCHPDKGGDQEIFKKLNNANEKGDFNLVEKIHKQVVKKK